MWKLLYLVKKRLLEMRKISIYGLYTLSKPDAIRYVGQTSQDVKRRVYGHKYYARKQRSPVKDWLNKYENQIDFVVLEENAKWNESEIKWILKVKNDGHDLLNCTNGGRSIIGYKYTKEQLSAHSDKVLKLWKDPVYREKVMDKQKGRNFTKEHLRKLSIASKRLWSTKEFRSNILEARKKEA